MTFIYDLTIGHFIFTAFWILCWMTLTRWC